jgi:shikimate kinase
VSRSGCRRASSPSSTRRTVATAAFPQPDDSRQIIRGKAVADKLNDTSLFLIGIMGTGKSTVGAALAKALGYNHLDTDDVIKSVTKKTVAEVFASVGEQEFRALETMILAEVAAYKRCVISTGGGIVCEKTNWMHLHNGVTLRLTADNALLADRLYADGVDKRPLLQESVSENSSGDEAAIKAEIIKKLEALLTTREVMYKQADITIPLGSRDDAGAPVNVVVDRILDALDSRVDEDAKQEKLKKAPEAGDITVTDPRGELGPKPDGRA